VEATTGPLGQGFAMAVGMAMAERALAATYNKPGYDLFDHYTYALVSDGDLMEGVASEAASLAGTLGLSKLIFLYDDNHMTIEGTTDLTFTEDVKARFLAYGWQVIVVSNGEELPALELALSNAKADRERPSLIMCRTKLGAGSPKADRPEAHGEPLGPENLAKTREFYGYGDKEPFFVDERVYKNFRDRASKNQEALDNWYKLLEDYGKEYPELKAELLRRLEGLLPTDLDVKLDIEFPPDKPIATRAASGIVVNALAGLVPELIGGSADLAPSNKTTLNGLGSFLSLNPNGRNIHYGVRESAMGAIMNGLALHGGFIPYGGTFLVFSDYLRPALRLSALMGQRVIYVLSHDSVGVGEDGPTHQPVEHIAALRAMPRLLVLRPADAYETLVLWLVALERKGPSALILSRQNLKVLNPKDYPSVLEGPKKGGYILKDAPNGQPSAIVIASGSEVSLALCALDLNPSRTDVRLVSMPSFELFSEQSPEYRESVLPEAVQKRLVVEAGVSLGWERYAGDKGTILSNEDFGFSAPADVIFKELGFTKENVAKLIEEIIS
jgi:transketolase